MERDDDILAVAMAMGAAASAASNPGLSEDERELAADLAASQADNLPPGGQ